MFMVFVSERQLAHDYYVGRPTSEDDLHGVGAFLLAAMAVYEYLED